MRTEKSSPDSATDQLGQSMNSLGDAFPPDIAQQINPEWRKNETGYWSARDQLLEQYEGRWIAFADGGVIAAGSTPLEVFLAIKKTGKHPFVIRVGHEDKPWYRIRSRDFGQSPFPTASI